MHQHPSLCPDESHFTAVSVHTVYFFVKWVSLWLVYKLMVPPVAAWLNYYWSLLYTKIRKYYKNMSSDCHPSKDVFQQKTNRTGPKLQSPSPPLCPMGLFTYGLTEFWGVQLPPWTPHILFRKTLHIQSDCLVLSLCGKKWLWMWQRRGYRSAQVSSW